MSEPTNSNILDGTQEITWEETPNKEAEEIEEILRRFLHSLCDIYNTKSKTNHTIGAICDTIFTKNGIELFVDSCTESKAKGIEIIEQLLMMEPANSCCEGKIIEEEIQQLNHNDNTSTYKKVLAEENRTFLDQHNVKLDDNTFNFCVNFQICFKIEPTTSNIADTTRISRFDGTSSSNTRIFSLFDPLLNYSKFTKAGIENEWTYLTCIIENACLSNDQLLFQTDGPFNMVDECLDRALKFCDIPSYSFTSSLKRDCHVIASVDTTLNHICLVIEHQRDNCSSIWKHKDFAKILLLMRTCLKSSMLTAQRNRKHCPKPLRTFGILSSRDNIFILCMQADLLSVENVQIETFGIEYALTSHAFSLNKEEEREQFIEKLTAHLDYFRAISLVEKEYQFLSSPNTSISKLRRGRSVMVYESFLTSDNNMINVYPQLSSMKEYFKNYDFEFKKEIGIEKPMFEKQTTHLAVIPYSKLNEFELNSYTKVMVVGFVATTNLQGFIFTKNKTSKLQKKDTNYTIYTADDEQIDKDDEDYKEKPNTFKKRNRNTKGTGLKKQKVSTITKEINYSDNLKEIVQGYEINGKTATKIRNNDKIALYFKLESGFLKIVHYFDNSSENVNGMEIVKSIQHDNINKIFQFKKHSITSSQLDELFFESIPLTTQLEPTIFVTFSQFVGDIVTFYIYLNQKDFNTKLLCFIKLMMDAIEAINILHENNIIHSDISIRNVGVLFTKPVMTAHAKEKSTILEQLPKVSNFNFILLDFNHCKVEGQEQATFPECNNNSENMFFPFISEPYCPPNELVQFTKEHDYYSIGLVLAQLFLTIVCNVPISKIFKWEKGNLKERTVSELNKKMKEFNNIGVIVQMLKDVIENEGKSEIFHFKKTFNCFTSIWSF